MATRSGDLDPGLIVWLLRHQGIEPDTLEDALERRSGLLGLAVRDLVDPDVEDRRLRPRLHQLEKEGELPPARAERDRVCEPHGRSSSVPAA